MKVATGLLLAAAVLLVVGGSANALTKEQAIEQCKAQIQNDHVAVLRRQKTGASPADDVRKCVRIKMKPK